MAHWQIGQKEQARPWFDQAEKHQCDDGEFVRLRAELAQLMRQDEKSVSERTHLETERAR